MERYNGKEQRQMYDINLSLNHLFITDFFLRSLNFVLPRRNKELLIIGYTDPTVGHFYTRVNEAKKKFNS